MNPFEKKQKLAPSETPEKETVKIVPVEELIPDIKAQKTPACEQQWSGRDNGLSFSETFIGSVLKVLTREKKEFEAVQQRIKNKIVVDLGSGDTSCGYFISLIFGAKAYVGVDPFNARDLKDNLEQSDISLFEQNCHSSWDRCDRENEFPLFEDDPFDKEDGVIKPNLKLIPIAIEKNDMLNFLERLPDDSVVVFTFGLDNNILRDEVYRNKVSKEIKRVLNKEGLWLNFGSDLDSDHLEELDTELGKDKAIIVRKGKGIFFTKEK